MMLSCRLITISFTLLLAACAGSPGSSNPSDLKNEASTLHVVVMTRQQGLEAQYVPSAAATKGGGMAAGTVGLLVGAGIDRAQNRRLAREANAEVMPFREMVSDIDFPSRFSNTIKSGIADVNRWQASEVVEIASSVNFSAKDYLPTIDEDQLILLEAEYSLSPEFDLLNVGVVLSLYKNRVKSRDPDIPPRSSKTYVQYQSRRLNPRHRPLTAEELEPELSAIDEKYDEKISDSSIGLRRFYRTEKRKEQNNVSARTVDLEPPSDKDAWSSEMLASELEQGIEQVARLIVMHLNDQRTARDYEALERRIPAINRMGNLNEMGLDVYEFAKLEDATVYRTAGGELYYVPSGEVLNMLAGFNRDITSEEPVKSQ